MTAQLEHAPSSATGPATAARPAPAIDTRELRDAFGTFATGVTVVTYEAGGEVLGATVNSFTSVSLEPALVLVSLHKSSKAGAALAGTPFTINILAKDQLGHALQFAGRPQEGLDIAWDRTHTSPRIAGSMAWFGCEPWQAYDGGDHLLVVGRVSAFGHRPDAEPLVFYRGGWRDLA